MKPTLVAVSLLLSWSCGFAARSRSQTKGNQGNPLKQTWPWYKSGDEIHSSMQTFASSCTGAQASLSTMSRMNTAEKAGTSVDLDVMRIRGNGSPSGAKVKALLVFGEHARELITGEAALGLTQALCGQGPSAEHANR